MLIEAAPADALPDTDHDTEPMILRILARILRSGTFGIAEVETLAFVAGDDNVNEADRCFAGRSIAWLAQQNTITTTSI